MSNPLIRYVAMLCALHGRLVLRWWNVADRATGYRAGRIAARLFCLVARGVRVFWSWLRYRSGRYLLPVLRRWVRWLAHRLPRLLWRWIRRAIVTGWASLVLAWSGLVWTLGHVFPYVTGYLDFREVVRDAVDKGDATRAKTLRQQWRKAAKQRITRSALTFGGLVLGLWYLSWRYGSWVWWAFALLWLIVFVGTGLFIRERDERTAEEAAKAEGEPFPIADAHTRSEAQECVKRAVEAEGIALRSIQDAYRQPWGWQVPVVLKSGKPADLVGKIDELETTFDLPAGGLFATPDTTRRARVVLRLAERDAFTDLPPAPVRKPGFASITDAHVIARRMDGEDVFLSLAGVHVVVVGSTGSGKSKTLLALADAVTACADAIAWDLDPAGDGLAIMGKAIGRTERHTTRIEDALADAVALAESRARMISGLGMGDSWEPTPGRPAVVVFIDEYPQLSSRAKALAVRLLRTGRKARVTAVLATTEATSDALGAAIADTVAAKILMPCRHGDVRLVLGPNRLAEGWHPHRLNPASSDSPEDAGKAFIYAAGSREPIVSKIRPPDPARIAADAAARAELVPSIDPESWDASRVRRAADPSHSPRAEGDERTARDVLASFAADRRLWTEEVLTRLAVLDAARYTGWTPGQLADALRPFGITSRQVWREGRNRNGYVRDQVAAALAGEE